MDKNVIIIIAVIVFCCLISSSIAAFFLLQEDSKPVTSEEKKPATSEEATTPAPAQEEANSQYPAGSFGRLGYICLGDKYDITTGTNPERNTMWHFPVKKDNPQSDPYCASYNETDCLRRETGATGTGEEPHGSFNKCQEFLKTVPTQEIKPLKCGTMHQQKHGISGYERAAHWCKLLGRPTV